MSQAILYHTQGVSVYRHTKFFSNKGEDFYRIHLPLQARRYANCGSSNVWVKETVERRFRGAPNGGRSTTLGADVPNFFVMIAKRFVKRNFLSPSPRNVI